jgi:hypothetical protein
MTPLELALRGCGNIDIENMVLLARVLLDAGAEKTFRMKGFVEEIGKCSNSIAAASIQSSWMS